MTNRHLHILRNVVIGVFAAALIAGILLPIYTDEVGWRFQERAGFDGVDKLFNDICGPNTLAVPPLFMMPVRYFSAYLNAWFADPLYVRVSGILYALAWLVLLLALVRRIAEDRRERAILGLWAVGLVSLANMPLLLVISRPEQPLLLAATAALLIALADRASVASPGGHRATSAMVAWRRSFAILLLGGIALSYHVKGIFLVPLLLVCLCLAARGRSALLPRAVAGGALLVATALSFRYWSARLDCPGDPILQAAYKSQNFGSHLASIDSVPDLVRFAFRLIGNIDLWAYGKLALPQEYPLSSWLPRFQVTSEQTDYWAAFFFFFWLAGSIFCALCLLRAVTAFFRERAFDRRAFLSLSLIAVMIAWSASQNHRNVYEAGWVVPLLAIAIVLAMSAGGLTGRSQTARTGLAALLGFAAIGSVILTAATYGPALLHSNAQRAYIPAQPFSLPNFGYAGQKPLILAAARKCGIGDPARARGLLVDDFTYFTFMQSYRPQHRLGVFSVWNGTIDDPVAYLKSRGSGGMVVGCHMLPADLRGRAHRVGSFCCLGPPNW